MEEQEPRALGGNRVKKRRLENVRQICEKTEGIRGWGRNSGDVGRVPGEKRIQREASEEVKGERVSWEESCWAGVSGGWPGCERLRLKGVRRTAGWERRL